MERLDRPRGSRPLRLSSGKPSRFRLIGVPRSTRPRRQSPPLARHASSRRHQRDRSTLDMRGARPRNDPRLSFTRKRPATAHINIDPLPPPRAHAACRSLTPKVEEENPSTLVVGCGSWFPMSERLVDAAEVGRMLGVSRARVGELAKSDQRFPVANVDPAGYRIWLRDQVERWALSHPSPDQRGPRPDLPVIGGVAAQTEFILSLAVAEARELSHPGVGADHLALALLRPDCPGAAPSVLRSLGFGLDDVRRAFRERLGDPFDPLERVPAIAPATRFTLARANRMALELQDEEVASEHVLLALADECNQGEGSFLLAHYVGMDGACIVRDRVVAVTEGTTPISELAAARPPHRPLRAPLGPPLAPSPAGHNPLARQPWGSAVFDEPDGVTSTRTDLVRQYFVDRDGSPVLTTDGRPVHLLRDEEGKPAHGEEGQLLLTPVEMPDGCAGVKPGPET